MPSKKLAAPAAEEMPEAAGVAEEAAPVGLAALGDEHRRAWRLWRARGGDDTWRKVTETGFVPFARGLGLDVPNEITETAAEVDVWAADVLHREPAGTKDNQDA